MKNLTPLLDFFLPRFCPSCKANLLTEEDTICNKCLSRIKKSDPDRIRNEFERKFSGDRIISEFYSHFIFIRNKELQLIIHELKYNGKFRIGHFLGKHIAVNSIDITRKWNVDLIIPVPIHHLKKAERGFNQSHFIARGLGEILNLPVKSRLLKRVKYTESQTDLSITERKMNVKDLFFVSRPSLIKNKRILLVDDVITTGATVTECGRALLTNGASKVFAVSVAIAD